MKMKNRFIVIWVKGEYLKIMADTIAYCRADGCYSWVILDNGIEYFISKSLSSIETCLKTGTFIRCHNSFLVNVIKIEKYCPKTKTLNVNGQILPVSRRKGTGVLRELKNNSHFIV